MNNIEQIQELLAQQVAVRTDELLAEARPEVIDAVRAEVMGAVDDLIEKRVNERLAAMRPATEEKARVALLHELAAGGSDEDPVITIPTRKPLTPDMVHDILTKALDPITAARGIKKAGKKWACAFCSVPFDTQRAATMHSRKCDKRADILAASQQATATPPKKRRNGVVKKKTTKKPKRECIKPGCSEPSKGPRYHHLCADHQNAPKRHVQAWQRRLREAQAQ